MKKNLNKAFGIMVVALAIGTTSIVALASDLNYEILEINEVSENTNLNNQRGITLDGVVEFSSSSGGRGSINYNHYGNFAYDGRAYFENRGDSILTIKTYTPSGKQVHTITLEPNQSVIATFSQSVLKSDLSDGTGKFHISSSDGSTAKVYCRYNVLD